MSLHLGQIPSLTTELAAFEHLKIIVSSGFLCNFIQIFLILADNENWHNILSVLIIPDHCFKLRVTCLIASYIMVSPNVMLAGE